MAKSSGRFVVNHPKGWAVKAPGAERASGVYDTQAAAQAAARRIVHHGGGGEVVTQGRDGKFSGIATPFRPETIPIPPATRADTCDRICRSGGPNAETAGSTA